MIEQAVDVSLQAVADEEGVFQPFHQFGFLVRQFVRILRVDGREVVFEQRMRFAIQADGAVFVVDVFQQAAVVHPPFRMRSVKLPLQFKLMMAIALCI